MGRYDWLPSWRTGDVTVVLDAMACADLAERKPLLFDDLETWEQRSAAEYGIDALMLAIEEHPAVVAIAPHGHRLVDFAGLRLRLDIANLLRGWTLARAGAGTCELVCDPTARTALVLGVRAGLGLDIEATPYMVPAALPGSRAKRVLARPAMRVLAACSRPERVRIAAVAAGKLALALASLDASDLRAAGVGVMPFPGLDHGNSVLLATRRRLPLLGTYGDRRAGWCPVFSLPERLGLCDEVSLDRVLTALVGKVLAGTAPELQEAVGSLAVLDRARSLRALVLPSAAYGASRLLIEWAHTRNLRVGAMQHGIYAFRGFDGGDRLADVVFGWGEGTVEQAGCWRAPRATIVPVGVPGMACRPASSARPPTIELRRVLIATSNTVDTPIAPVAFCEMFVEAIAPGLRRLVAAGVELQLRPHPNEDRHRYRRLLSRCELEATVLSRGSFAGALAGVDLLISAPSSVAFEAAALGVPVLLWLGGAPDWVRQRHLVAPWADGLSGMFEGADDFGSMVDRLLERPREVLSVAGELGRRLAHYAQPFNSVDFADGLRALAA